MRYDGTQVFVDVWLRMGEMTICSQKDYSEPIDARKLRLLDPAIVGKTITSFRPGNAGLSFTNIVSQPRYSRGNAREKVAEAVGVPKRQSLTRTTAQMLLISDGNEGWFLAAQSPMRHVNEGSVIEHAVALSSRPPFDELSNETDWMLIPEWQDPEILGHAVLTLFGRADPPYIKGVASVLSPRKPGRRSALHKAALDGLLDELPPIGRRTRRNLDPKDTWGATPLMLAAANGHTLFVERLLGLGADHERSDNNGRSALHCAAESARNECAGVLIDAGADIHCTDDIGDTPLHLAATRGDESTVRLLLESGSDPNAADSAFSSTPLHKAVRGDHANLVPILVAAGAKVDSPNEHERTPLHVAVSYGHVDSARALIEAGADVDRPDQRGRTPLHTASFYQRLDCLALLIKSSADVGARDRDGDTPLHVAASMNRDRAAVMLLDGGADIEAADHEGLTALDMAIVNYHMHSHLVLVSLPLTPFYCREHNSEAAWALLERGASMDPMRIPVGDRHALWPHLTPKELLFDSGDIDYSRLTDLPESYREKLPEFGWYSVTYDSRVMYPTISWVMQYFSLLHDAVLKNMPGLVRTLLESGVSPMTAVRDIMTPLHVAVRAGNYELAQMLLDWGADINAAAHNYGPDSDRHHPRFSDLSNNSLDVATTMMWDPEMTRFLLDLGATIDRYSRMTDRLWDQVIKSRCPPERREAMAEVLTEFGLMD